MANSAFQLDATTGDLKRSITGRFVRCADDTYQAQQLRCDLLFFLGEWFLDLEGVGVPYFQSMLGRKSPNLDTIRQSFARIITARDFVRSLDSLDLVFDAGARALSVTFRCTSTSSAVLEGSFTVTLP